MKFLALVILIVASVGTTAAQTETDPDSALARELSVRAALDQAVRELAMVRRELGQPLDPADAALWIAVDSVNTIWLKGVIEERGWPLQSEVGEDAARDAWLLAQHADRDRTFQQEVLRLMEQAVVDGEASGADFAYLTDRVRIGLGELQVYGTQITMGVNGEPEPFPIEDAEHVDERRAVVGLQPLDEYLKFFR